LALLRPVFFDIIGFENLENYSFVLIGPLRVKVSLPFGLKSDPRQTTTPASIIFRTGGGTSFRIYAVVGKITAADPT